MGHSCNIEGEGAEVMAYSMTDSGVLAKSGRGKNAVALTISFKEIDRWAARMKKDTKTLWRYSYGRACSGLKKKFVEVMQKSGGVNGVPKFRDFEDFTKTLRAKSGRTATMGGVLAEKGSVVAFKRNGRQVIGWPDHMETAACSFQEGRGGTDAEKWFTDPEWRRAWHRQGIADIPRAYVHNERMVIMPYFVDYVRKNLDEWAKGAYYKGLVALMQGKGDKKFAEANL